MSSLPPRLPSSSAAAAAAQSKLLQDRTRGSTSPATTTSTTCRITRAVQTMSSFHRTSISETARKYFHSPQHFPRILGGLMLSSGIAGYVCMGWWYERQLEERKRIYIDAYHGVQASISSSGIKGGEGRNSSDNDERRVSLARKMTRRNVSTTLSSSSSSTTANDAHHAVLLNTTDSPLNLQRQVTKFW